MTIYPTIHPFRRGAALDYGQENGCPFCAARRAERPRVGQRVALLSGLYVGQAGMVVSESGWKEGGGRFQVRMAFEPNNVSSVIDPSLELFIDPEAVVIPGWMPPLSVEDCCGLHEVVLAALSPLPGEHSRKAAAKLASALSSLCWGARLPLTGAEIWEMLAAHGANAKLRAATVELYDFGLALLSGSVGRPPIKRKRMRPMSQGRYLTKRQRDLRIRKCGQA
jgi:hypothetical protein